MKQIINQNKTQINTTAIQYICPLHEQEFKGLCESSHNWLLSVIDIPHFEHHCVLQIPYLSEYKKRICFLIRHLECGCIPYNHAQS